jgi:NAD(P)-dependent dehydrogenase (short-subunit alcohol dehydrogenase family)
MPTILITGCSSGFGLETARLFLERGWNVVATMRKPDPSVLPASDRLRILPLDVTDPISIAHAVRDAGEIDVLVNNAGFGAPVPIELTPAEVTRQLFETNTFGTLAVTQAVLPQFRKRRAGVVINVTSSVTLKVLPLVGMYRAAKMAVNAFTESLAVEVEPLGIRVRLVLPGSSSETRFRDNAGPYLAGLDNPDYAPMIEAILARFTSAEGPRTHATDVAGAVWYAATDATSPLKIPAGADAELWMAEAATA